jgi:hypothetical protein
VLKLVGPDRNGAPPRRAYSVVAKYKHVASKHERGNAPGAKTDTCAAPCLAAVTQTLSRAPMDPVMVKPRLHTFLMWCAVRSG